MANAPTATKPPAAPEETAGGPRPLTEQEQRVMHELMSRAAAAQSPHAPAIRIGEPYQALTNLAVPRRGDPEHKTDLVLRGETVYLTPEEAASFMRCDPRRDGRRTPPIRKLSGPAGNELPVVTPRAMSGAPFGPPVEARPDPAGSSFIEVRNIPEANPPVPGSEATAGQEQYATRSREVNAMDLPPTRSAASDLREQVDPEVLAGLKAGVEQQEERLASRAPRGSRGR